MISRFGRSALMASTAIVFVAAGGPAYAQSKTFDIPAQTAATGIAELGRQADIQIVAARRYTQGKKTNAVRGDMTADQALLALLNGTGLVAKRTGAQTYSVVPVSSPPETPEADAGDGDEIIVTAQKRRESIQNVPIAMTALSQEDLTTRQIAGGPDLISQAPNIAFSKTNFTGYTIQIRGIGTQAVSATTDPAVAVAFNNTPFVRNRFFEQEFYDVERIEILRGPQGTLYGRNATAGVVNLISAKPEFSPEALLSVDLGNYKNRRVEGMINLPLVDDKVAFRLAGAMTKRDGYTTNQMTGRQIDGRDLWSVRASLRLEPTPWLRADFVYEHFQEKDDRLRSGKQLCKKDPGRSEIGGIPVGEMGGTFGSRTYLSQGCLPVSLYSAEAFQTPNGFALPFYGPTGNLGNSVYQNVDPYASAFQSRDLRVIESTLEPEYRAKTDIFQLQLNMDISDTLTFTSETAYSTDSLFSTQDYNRFTTKTGAFDPKFQVVKPQRTGVLDKNGVFCDPQLGCSDRLLLGDLSTAESRQFSQEIRLSSDFDGPFNFSIGGNYLRYTTEDRYYVFVNSLSMFAALQWGQATADNNPYVPGVSDNRECLKPAGSPPDPRGQYLIVSCVYIDPNPIGNLNGEGRNYFLSRNPYKLTSYAAFGEAYYNITPNLKLTGGLRFTVDKKDAPQIPSWLLASGVTGEYPTAKVVAQKWSEPTGRVAIDWQPNLAFTDHSLLYASFAHGYKAGGANPPPPVIATYGQFDPSAISKLQGAPETFAAEYVNAFEIGSKNTLFNGALTLNLGAFYYDYKDYQTSEIVNRSAVNSNYDAKIWGLEVEADWRPTNNLRLGFKGGYQKTRMANGSSAVDLMDRTAGDPNYVLVRPFPTLPSNCILPAYVLSAGGRINVPHTIGGSFNGPCVDAYYSGWDPVTGLAYVPNPTRQAGPNGTTTPLDPRYAGYIGFDPFSMPNGGQGISKDLSGNELPNAPNYTVTLTADYTIPLGTDTKLTLHGDYHYQSESWARVINSDPYDRLRGYSTVNVAAILDVADNWRIMAYVKNVFNKTALTGAFLNSDDTGLTTNVFLTEPRLYGLRVTRSFGASALSGLNGWRQREPGERYPLEVEFGMGVNTLGYQNASYAPAFLNKYLDSLPFADTAAGTQREGLGRSHVREARVTFNMPGGWHVSGAYRRGKFDAKNRGLRAEMTRGSYLEGLLPGDPPRPFDGFENFGTIDAGQREDHRVVDFMVGKDVGLGLMGDGGRSVLGLGVTYAQFGSATDLKMVGIPDWYRAEYEKIKYPTTRHTLYNASLNSTREFEGLGPSLSWEASRRLAGSDKDGSLNLDWQVDGGLLFGKQTMASREERDATYYHFEPKKIYPPQLMDTLYDETIDRSRSQRVTVPHIGASLGMSYRVGGVKVAAGYRWERFIGVMDGGIDKAESFDRTIQGPYVKVGIGF